jgi:alcohol dehydrogenase
LVVGERSMLGSITGSPHDKERTLAFSLMAGVRPRIEVVPLERAQEALARMRTGDAKFRMVLSMAPQACDH